MKAASRSAPPSPKDAPWAEISPRRVKVARFQELSSPIPPFNEPPKTKASLASEPFGRCRKEARPPPTRSGKSWIPPTGVPDCKQPSPPTQELRATSGPRRKNGPPPQRSRPVPTRENGRSAKGPSRRQRDFCRLPVRQRLQKAAQCLPGRLPSASRMPRHPLRFGATPSFREPQNPEGFLSSASRIRCIDAFAYRGHDENIE